MRALCSEHSRYLVMSGTFACLGLRCLAIFLLGFRGADVPLRNRIALQRGSSCLSASNKIKFKYLNRNLMVTKFHPITLASTAIFVRRTMYLLLCAVMMAL
jgi:hypothetical protein